MARNEHGKLFADGFWGQNAAPQDVSVPAADFIQSAWTAAYSQRGEEKPEREVFNALFRALSGLAQDINQHGLLEWDTALAYVHPATVRNSGLIWSSKQNVPAGNAPALGSAYWVPADVESLGGYAGLAHLRPNRPLSTQGDGGETHRINFNLNSSDARDNGVFHVNGMSNGPPGVTRGVLQSVRSDSTWSVQTLMAWYPSTEIWRRWASSSARTPWVRVDATASRWGSSGDVNVHQNRIPELSDLRGSVPWNVIVQKPDIFISRTLSRIFIERNSSRNIPPEITIDHINDIWGLYSVNVTSPLIPVGFQSEQVPSTTTYNWYLRYIQLESF